MTGAATDGSQVLQQVLESKRELMFVRHAQAWCNVEDTVGGPLGCRGLTRQGHDQARRLADRLAARQADNRSRVDALYCSPRLRAVETAEPVAEALNLPLRVQPDLREQDLGEADGLPRVVLHSTCEGNPVLQPWRAPAVGAESWSTYVDRIRRVLDSILQSHEGHRLLLITHGEAINAAHHIFLGLPPRWPGPLPVTVANAAITRWRREPWERHRPQLGLRWDLQAHNDTAHITAS
ncbi:histidine phosphatase family protein [Streptomyces monticola]|uniref:Histidine phosphatase family protein n=1 Tax=Streptomyces monticola TaxID=2666263 RepID=A0ABW2JG85_9ACTN